MEKLKRILHKIFLIGSGVIGVIIILGIASLIIFSEKSGITKNAQIVLGSSEMYSAEEIQAAMDVVLIQFKEFPAVLNKLWYDEERSKVESESWMEKYSGYDIIVLYSDFKTFKGEQAICDGFDPDQEYNNWQWVLIRSENEGWQLKSWGYS